MRESALSYFFVQTPNQNGSNPTQFQIQHLTSLVHSPQECPILIGYCFKGYYEFLASYDYEMFTDEFLLLESEYELAEELIPYLTPIDYLLGDPPQYRHMCPLYERIDS